jgi:hypothetical protein
MPNLVNKPLANKYYGNEVDPSTRNEEKSLTMHQGVCGQSKKLA